ncbi:hypothetical protein ACMT1E_11030 [Sphingomonas flavalba]|uniref:hypothetical protein n=1 Tax=Sphingomonas flavalba TaxID=2559804 RepID=UPI0039E037DE
MSTRPLIELGVDGVLALPNDAFYRLSPHDVATFQLELLRQRFADLRGRIAALGKLADLQGVNEIAAVDDAAPLLFQHTAYKSYPFSLLEKRKFQAMTRWLQSLTAHDLSHIDASNCHSIDDWFELLDNETPLSVLHSTGTTGKLSIIPRDKREMERFVRASLKVFEGYGDEPDLVGDLLRGEAKIPILYPSYRYGRHIGQRMLDIYIRLFGEPGTCRAMYEEMLSADVSSLAGRVRAAEERGELDILDIPPDLLRKYRESVDRQSSVAVQQKAFFDFMLENCRGQRVMSVAVVPYLWAWTQVAEAQGLERMFAANSIFTSGGGLKGMDAPADWRERIERFLGAPLNIGYGMTESMSGMRMCSEGHYHPSPLLVSILLDVDTGTPLPRTGTQTGRFAFFDLMPESYWGGFVTGDRVTLVHDQPCACGRTGAYALDSIRRFSELEGGDDKISCAGAADAQERAIEYLIERANAEEASA